MLFDFSSHNTLFSLNRPHGREDGCFLWNGACTDNAKVPIHVLIIPCFAHGGAEVFSVQFLYCFMVVHDIQVHRLLEYVKWCGVGWLCIQENRFNVEDFADGERLICISVCHCLLLRETVDVCYFAFGPSRVFLWRGSLQSCCCWCELCPFPERWFPLWCGVNVARLVSRACTYIALGVVRILVL